MKKYLFVLIILFFSSQAFAWNDCAGEKKTIEKLKSDIRVYEAKKTDLVEKVGYVGLGAGLAYLGWNPIAIVGVGILVVFQ